MGRVGVMLCVCVVLSGCALEPYTYESSANLGSAMDEPALSTSLDRRDVQVLFEAHRVELMESAFIEAWSVERGALAVMPMRNRTSEHIAPQLEALLSKLEGDLVWMGLDVVSRARRSELLTLMRSSSEPEIGRMLGARYVLTGKVFDVAERTYDARRVQYTMFMQVVDVESGAIVWQHESKVSKGLGKALQSASSHTTPSEAL